MIGENAPAGEWITSSYCQGGDQCVEVGTARSGALVVLVRDSTRRHGPVLAFSRLAWGGFVETVALVAARK